MNTGKAIRSLRKEMELTQDEFASRVGIHGRQLARYEINKNIPSISAIVKIAGFCGVTTDYLIYGRDNQLGEQLRIKDPELVDLLRMVNRLKRLKRERIKWAIRGLLKSE